MQLFRRKCAAYGRAARLASSLTAAALMLPGCDEPASEPLTTTTEATPSYACGANGYLATTLYGAIAADLEWGAADLDCEGMPRPNDEGARLRFAGHDGERQLAIIIALPALERGATGTELPSNVTLIEEGNGRFFSTTDLNNCWTDITSTTALRDSDSQYEIGGTLYCVQPLAEVNGASSVTLSELRFQGLLDWGAG